MTEQENKGAVRIFSARACAEPLEKAAQLFEEKTGIHVELATQFMDFLASAESRVFYKEYGWEIPAE